MRNLLGQGTLFLHAFAVGMLDAMAARSKTNKGWGIFSQMFAKKNPTVGPTVFEVQPSQWQSTNRQF